MAKALIEINDIFTFIWNKTTIGSENQKRKIPEFVKVFFEKNISNRLELLGDEFFDKYTTKYYAGDTRVKNWSPGVKEIKIRPNPEKDSFFLIEFEFLFRGNKGGILYQPSFTKESEIKVELIEVIHENEDEIHYNLKVMGSLHWDYKTSDFNKHIEKVEEGGTYTWENASMDLRINFRDNYELKKYYQFDEKGYKLPVQPINIIEGKTIGKPEDDTNICFILDIMPNVLTVISNQNSLIGHSFKSKNIHMKCKFLNF